MPTRFKSLMAEALYCAETDEGRALSLEDVSTRLLALADAERSSSSDADAVPGDTVEEDARRFAVYAWVDERMLSSGRPDAMGWVGHCLQARYFKTTVAGNLFYEKLGQVLDRCAVPSRSDEGPLTLAGRLGLAAGVIGTDAPSDTLRLYARCLLFGFRGRLDDGQELLRIRKNCRSILRRPESGTGDEECRTHEAVDFGFLWQFLWVLGPILVCAMYYVWSAYLLAERAGSIS